MTNPNGLSRFRLPHENPTAPRTPAATRPRTATTAHAGHENCTVGHATERRRSAYRTVASLTTGIAVAAGLGALGTSWVAEQATAAAAATTVDAAPADTPAAPSALPTPGGRMTTAPGGAATTKAKRSATRATTRTTAATTRTATRTATARATAVQPPVVRVTAPAPAAPVNAGTHAS